MTRFTAFLPFFFVLVGKLPCQQRSADDTSVNRNRRMRRARLRITHKRPLEARSWGSREKLCRRGKTTGFIARPEWGRENAPMDA
jgi:hypothetical protein